MRIVPLLMLIGTACGTVPSWAGDVFGLWKVTPPSSTDPRFSRERLTVRFEPHAKGEVFTLDRIDGDGRSTTSSTILYLDSKPRDFQGFGCSGTQSSRRLDSRDGGDPAHLRERRVDTVRPAVVHTAKRAGPGDYGTAARRPPLRAAPGAGEAIRSRNNAT